MQKRIRVFLVLLTTLSLALAVAGCGTQNSSQNVTVTTATANRQELESRLEFSGILVPAQTVDIASKLSGQVTALGFRVGQPVKAGDVLIRVDTEALNGQLLAAQATLQGAQAAAESAQNQAAISQINLAAAQINYDQAKALFDAGALSQNQLNDAQDKFNIASQQFATASGPAQAQAAAAINSAYANIKNLSVQIGNATIKSPIDGIVTIQNINLGQIVAPNVTVISIVDTSTLKLKTTVEQDNLSRLANGQTINVYIDSYPDTIFPGTITAIGPIAVNTGEVFPLEISLNNDTGLLAGLSAHASLTTKTQGIIIPIAALQQANGESYVFVIADNIAAKRIVKTGLKNDQDIEIVDGLKQDELVATNNLTILTDQMPVVVR